MTNAIDIHAKARVRDEHAALERLASTFLARDDGGGFAPVKLKASEDHDGRLFTLDLAPADVQPVRVSGPGIIGSIDGMKLAQDVAAPVRKVRHQFGDLQTMVTTTDLSKLVRPMGGGNGGATPPAFNPKVTVAAYNARDWELDIRAPHEVVKNADRDLSAALGSFARDLWKLVREFRVAQLLTTQGSWNANNQVNPSNQWSGASGKPVQDIFSALQKSKNPRPNAVIMSENVGQYWYSNTTVQAFYMTGALKELGLEVITVGAKYGASGGFGDIWGSIGNNVVVCRTGTDRELTTAATARWDGDEIRSVPKDERWIFVDGVLLRCFWSPKGGARGIDHCIIACNEDVVMLDNTLGAIILAVA